MTFPAGWAHVTLSPVILVAATAVACVLVAVAVIGLRRWGARGAVKSALGIALVIAGVPLPLVLVRAGVELVEPSLVTGRQVFVCFGEPHWNMVVAAALPPLVGLLLLVGLPRKQEGVA